ncbi:MAG: cytochrome c biogenesis protein ResB, partial [Bacteroidales bacterium]|nr:cytochrome c biogenesis protein ResB [Bacteroidales bacterium]
MDMIKKITRFITSMPFMGILLLILAAAIAVATFIENAYGPVAAQGTIYQAWWFELAILLVFVNLAYNIFKYKLYTLKKLPLFLFHLAFLVIIAGAALTRFTGEEGMMGIREGDIRDLYKSDDTFFYIRVVSQGDTVEKYQKIYLSSINKKQVRLKFRFGKDIIRVRSVDYISGNRMRMNSQMSAMGRHPDVLHLKIGINNGEEDLMIRGLPKSLIMANESDIAGLHFTTGFGVRKHRLPFALELKNFQLDRYPGSMSPSSFASEVVLIDEAHDITRPFRIYMNNILKYRGYRFYQSSYDSDEKGTVLSVNHDPLGTRVTYFGYFLMMICIILALFTPGSRFKRLLKITGKKATFTAVLMIGLLVSQSIHAQSTAVKVDVKEAKAFGRIWVQGSEGRFKPANSMAMEIIRKLTGNNRYRGYSPEQFWLGLMISTDYWQNEKLFKLDRPQLRKMIGVSSDKASFNDFFKDNSYLLGGMVATAQRKNPNQRNPLDKALLKLDEKLNVFYMALNGAYLKVFPDPTDLNARWLAPTDRPVGFPSEDSLFIVSGFGQYLQALNSDSLDITASLRQHLI